MKHPQALIENRDLHFEISEVQVVPIKPANGLVGFASLVVNRSLFLGSIAIMSRPGGGYRLLYPNKKLGNTIIDMFHPINRSAADILEDVILAKFEDVMNKAAGFEHIPA